MNPRLVSWLVAMAAALGLILSSALLWQSLRGGSVVGCGGASCDAVTSSRWGYVLGVPVSAFGMANYALILGSFLLPRGNIYQVPLLAVLPGAALWFVFVQAVFLRAFCLPCNSLHIIGLFAFSVGLAAAGFAEIRRSAVWACAAFLTIGLLQIYGPVRQGHLIEQLGKSKPSAPAPADSPMIFDGGKRVIHPNEHPRLGPADADRVLVEYFDYQCPACQTMAGHIEALVAAHPGRIAVLLMPVPLDGSCNAELGAVPSHPGSCEIARISLAVWRNHPEAFPHFHQSLVASPSHVNARTLAAEIFPDSNLAAALADPWIEQTLQKNIEAWRRYSRSTNKLPKLLISEGRILHGLPSNTSDFIRVMEQELGL